MEREFRDDRVLFTGKTSRLVIERVGQTLIMSVASAGVVETANVEIGQLVAMKESTDSFSERDVVE